MYKFKRRKINKSIILFSVFLIMSIYFFRKKYFINFAIDDIKNHFNNSSIFELSSSKLVYSNLNRFVDYNNEEIKLEEIDDSLIFESHQELDEPLVYIYNSHQTESYSYNDLSHTIKPTVYYASFILKDYLNDLGIESLVETKSMKEYLVKNNLEYKDSYEASRNYIKELKSESIKYYIDLHRDSSKIDKTLYEKDNIRYARVMFVVGMRHNNSYKNLEFITKFNNKINEKYKGLSRGIYKRDDARFNQDISDRAMLIELGGVDNTLEEINNTLKILSKILYEIIEDENGN